MVLQSIQNGTKNRMISQGFGLEKITGKITTARAAPPPEADSVPAASDERAPIALCARHRPLLSHVSHRKPFVVVLVGCQLSCCTDASPFCQNTVVLRKEWRAVPTQCPLSLPASPCGTSRISSAGRSGRTASWVFCLSPLQEHMVHQSTG